MLNSTRLGPWISLVVGLSLLCGVVTSCGGDDSNDAGATCSLGRSACEFGCTTDLGCVECLSDNDCQPGAPVCVIGRCVACRDNADCGTGQVCAPATHQCTTGCQADTDCARPNNGNNNAPFCDTKIGACVGCRTTADCSAPRPVCEPTRQQCSECQSRADCAKAAPACNLQNGNCEECLVDADCGNGRACGPDHQCRELCTSNDFCVNSPAGPICNLSTGVCGQCASAKDCTNPATPVCSPENRCVACAANSDCPTATPICETNVRGGIGLGGARCVACTATQPCTDTTRPICSQTGLCVQCQNNRDCTDPTLSSCNAQGTCAAGA